MSDRTRGKNYLRLIAEFEHLQCESDRPARPMPRYAAFMEEFFDEERVGVKLVLCATEQEAFDVLGPVLEGYVADGVYDLDTAEKINVEVSTPIVTRARVQGAGVNWLEE